MRVTSIRKDVVLFLAATVVVTYLLLTRDLNSILHPIAELAVGNLNLGQGPPGGAASTEGGADDNVDQIQTHDHWPALSKLYYPGSIRKSPYHPDYTIKWDFNNSAFLQRPDVKNQPPKIITWMVKTRYMPPLQELVRLRVCPEMPCRMTTNHEKYREDSAALLWAGQIMRDAAPPVRPHLDQVFVFHNHEPQTPEWIFKPSFRKPAWKSAFNWTMNYRFDSDIVIVYGSISKRETPVKKNYTEILAKKTKKVAWLVSHCTTHGRREDFVKQLQQYIAVDAYGVCGPQKCPRTSDDACLKMINDDYKFYLAFENALCRDYVSEKFFRYMEADTILVARGCKEFKNHGPPGIFVNTADFKSIHELGEYLQYMDSHPEHYIKLLQAKDQYRIMYEDWPVRFPSGDILFMAYHYEAVSFCEMCRRLWDLDSYRKTIPDIVEWFDKENCYPPKDIH